MDSYFDRWNRKLDEISDETRVMDQHVASLEQDARQPRLAMEADGLANTKTRERTEGTATAVQAMHGDSCTAQKVQDGRKNSTSFGVKTEPLDLPCREDVLVEDGAAAPKLCPSSLEMRSPSPASDTSTATRTTFNKSSLQLYATKKTNLKKENLWTSVPYASYDISVFQKSNLPATPYCRRVIET